jgi:hypothetical protein
MCCEKVARSVNKISNSQINKIKENLKKVAGK